MRAADPPKPLKAKAEEEAQRERLRPMAFALSQQATRRSRPLDRRGALTPPEGEHFRPAVKSRVPQENTVTHPPDREASILRLYHAEKWPIGTTMIS